ncbi:unnamed protein product [Rotaria sp. Silwood1]|nr:unnamed protein product [Rotaria sp. Silwood1]CAF4905469.1 unnamed protein product [Rotaria sp. Silwood1]CAF4973879.1 unnamed protein product [Rotaria sp. Silwood1]
MIVGNRNCRHARPELIRKRRQQSLLRNKQKKLPLEEDLKCKQRSDRNKQAAAKYRRKQNDLREELEKSCFCFIIYHLFSIYSFLLNMLTKYSNNNNDNNKCVIINFISTQDLLVVAPLTRKTTSDASSSSSSVTMIRIHIIPEVAQGIT